MHAVAFSKEDQFRTTELDFFIGKSFLVTHHSEPLATVSSTIERVQKNPASITRGIDRLAHFLLDTMVDAYQPVLNDLTQEIHTLEDTVFLSSSREPTDHPEFRGPRSGSSPTCSRSSARSATWSTAWPAANSS